MHVLLSFAAVIMWKVLVLVLLPFAAAMLPPKPLLLLDGKVDDMDMEGAASSITRAQPAVRVRELRRRLGTESAECREYINFWKKNVLQNYEDLLLVIRGGVFYENLYDICFDASKTDDSLETALMKLNNPVADPLEMTSKGHPSNSINVRGLTSKSIISVVTQWLRLWISSGYKPGSLIIETLKEQEEIAAPLAEYHLHLLITNCRYVFEQFYYLCT